MSHLHFCDIGGHEYECAKTTCRCICGALLNEGDHSGCPIGLVGCPDHIAEQLSTAANTGAYDSDLIGKLKTADEMPDGAQRNALLQEIFDSIFPGANSGDNH